MIVLDASVLIAHFASTDPHHGQADQLLTAYHQHEFIVNTITLAEFLVGPARTNQADDARRALDTLRIRVHGLDESESAWHLADLRARTGLKLPDCCVLYTAQHHAESLVASFDTRLLAQAQTLGLRTADTSAT